MPDVHGDRATHDQHVDWTARKRTALRRPTLDCGHRNAGEVFYHAWCDRLSCSEECANGPHDCSAFAGVKSGIEERPEPVEVAPSAPALRWLSLPGDWRLHDHSPAEGDWPGGNRYGYSRERVLRERRWTGEEVERAAEHGINLPDIDWLTIELWWDMPREHTVEMEPPPVTFFSALDDLVPLTETPRQTTRTAKRYGKHRWDTDPFAHVGSAPTCRECGTPYRMQIGRDLCSACLLQPPAHDRVADAMRAEVLRQGLTECEIDGVRQEYRDGQWLAAGGVVRSPWRPFGVSRECAMSSGSRCGACDGHALDNGSCMHNCHGLEPVAPPVDAALEPEPLRTGKSGKWLSRLFPGRSTR